MLGSERLSIGAKVKHLWRDQRLAGLHQGTKVWYISQTSRQPEALVKQELFECWWSFPLSARQRSEEHTSELQSRQYLVCRLLLEKKKNQLCSEPVLSLHR